jgi:electron transport complex protein RnfC
VDGFLPTFLRRKASPPLPGRFDQEGPASKMEIPERVVMPLQDTPDTPYEVVVQAEEEVRSGQLLGWMGNAPARLGVHASISGKVDRIGLVPHPLGVKVHAVAITSDGTDEGCGSLPLKSGEAGDNGQKAIEGFRERGIPLNYGLLYARGFKVSSLLVNATEFEPYITSSHQLIREVPQNLVEGLKVLMGACAASRAVVLLEKDRPSLIKALKGAGMEAPGIAVRGTGRPYPETATKEFLLRKLLSGGSAPAEVMSVSLSSLFAIYRAWSSGDPFTERLITIAGSGIKNPQNTWVKIGTPLAHIIQCSGGSPSCLGRVAVGGPLMGIPQHSLEVPLVKKARGVFAAVAFLFDEHRRSRFYKRIPCVKCAKCVDVCPASIIPSFIAGLIDNKLFNDAEQWGVFNCIECGLCEYVCPSRIPLLELMKHGKVSLKGAGCLLTRSNLETLSG